jgi:Zn-dependent M28 family amino/carboxypeptidase
VVTIASTEHNVDYHEALEQAALYLEHTLAGYGYTVTRQEFETETRKVHNLEVTLTGASAPPAGDIVVGAHYDSVLGAPGANDNGSGVAAVLELARLLRSFQPAPGRTLHLVLWVNEEPPYFKTEQMGSWVHAQALSQAGRPVAAVLSLETIGWYSEEPGSQQYPFPFDRLYPGTGNFLAFVGDLHSRALVRRALGSFRANSRFPSEGASVPALVEGADWSDHWSYAQFGMPAIMLTDTAPFRYPYYHTAQDTPDKVGYESLARVVKGVEAVVRDLSGRP